MQEHRLRVVLPVVGGGDAVRAQVLRRLLQKAVAELPGRVLHAPPGLPGKGGHVPAPAEEGDAPPGAPGADKGLVPVRCGAEAVVEVGGGHLEPLLRPEDAQQVEQGHGIPPPGDGAEHRPPLGEHIVLPAEGPDLPDQGVNSRPHRSASPRC